MTLPWRLMAHQAPELSETGALLWRFPAASLPELPPAICWKDVVLQRKHEFHLTLAGRADMARLGLVSGLDARRVGIVELWPRLAHEVTILDDLWVLEKAPESGESDFSLVAACDAPAMAAARQWLAEEAGVDLAPAPPHVTLYAGRDPHGIALPNQAALDQRRVARGTSRTLGLG